MVLYLEIETYDHEEKRIPMLNYEWENISENVQSVRIVDEVITGRDDLIERRYQGYELRKVIQNLREGDKVIVKTEPESYRDRTLTVTHFHEEAEAVDENGKEFYIIPSYWGGKHGHIGDGDPWLRDQGNYDSYGRIEEVEIIELA